MGGGDKCLLKLGDQTLLARAVARAGPQVDALLLNANGDPSRFAGYGLPVTPDLLKGYAGPLAGILTGMAWAQAEHSNARWLASFAIDAPFFPLDLVTRFVAATEDAGALLACAASGGRTHPVFGLWSLSLRGDLDRALAAGARKIDAWTAGHPLATVTFAIDPLDPFFNINAPEDLTDAAHLIASLSDA